MEETMRNLFAIQSWSSNMLQRQRNARCSFRQSSSECWCNVQRIHASSSSTRSSVFDATVQVLVIRYYYQLILEVRLHRGYLVTLDPANRIWPDPTPRYVLHFRTLHPLPFIFASIFLTTEIPARRGSHAASSPAPSSFLPPSNRNTRLKHRHMTSPLLRIVRFISNIPIAKHRERTDFDHDTSYARESIFCNFCPNSPL